jgi:hypothetical protein
VQRLVARRGLRGWHFADDRTLYCGGDTSGDLPTWRM